MMTIPYQNIEIEQAYYQLLNDPFKAIAVCSVNEKEGCTSLALALAKRNLVAGYSTLIVDLNLFKPAFKEFIVVNEISEQATTALPEQVSSTSQAVLQSLTSPQLVSTPDGEDIVTGIVAPTSREHVLKLKQAGAIEQCIAFWREEYDTIIIDTSPINRLNANNIPAERVASACDGAVLSILGGITTTTMLETAVAKLRASDTNILGCIYNDQYNPGLKEELHREVARLSNKFSWLKNHLNRWLANNKLLSLEL